MGELHVNMNITLDGVIQANGGPSEEDAGRSASPGARGSLAKTTSTSGSMPSASTSVKLEILGSRTTAAFTLARQAAFPAAAAACA